MKKKRISLLVLGVFIMQVFGSTVSAIAVAPNENNGDVTASSESELVNGEDLLGNSGSEEESSEKPIVEREIPNEVQDSSKEKEEPDSIQPSSELNLPVIQKATDSSSQINITDEILSSMTIADINGTEYDQLSVNRVLNGTAVVATLNFNIEDKEYTPGSTYTMNLPDYLGYSDISGVVSGVDAEWSVVAASKTLTIRFNQRIKEAQFKLDLRSYLYTEKMPLVTIETPGQTKNTYKFDLYENIEPISYTESRNNYGIEGDVAYNLDRTLSGNQSLELLTADFPGTQLGKNDRKLVMNVYDVDIKGNLLTETKQELVKGVDYTIGEDTVAKTTFIVAAMNPQKAYVLSIIRDLYVESVSNYEYYLAQNYPTTKLGSLNLMRTTGKYGGLEFSAKTSLNQKVLMERFTNSFYNGGFQSNRDYSVGIYGNPAKTTIGQKIIIESQNGQEIEDYTFSAWNESSSVPITDYFDISHEGTKLVLTATKDSVLRISVNGLKIPFAKKDVTLALSTPVIGPDKEFVLLADQYVEPISIINPNNVETAWGNYDQNGAYTGRTTIHVDGSSTNPIENLEVKVKHPKYLSLRPAKSVVYYQIDKDYTITETSDGSIIKFTTPIKFKINIPLGFNYVPDSLGKDVFIPIDTIPVTMSADGQDTVDTSVRTGSKQGSERTFQGSKNQFLVNARNDSFDSLIVNTKVPTNAEVAFTIYDISNDMVENVYPQYWNRGGVYFSNPINPGSKDYPNITIDEAKNSYKFDFGKTSKRYIIEYKRANGWIDSSTPVYITGTAAEPLYSNQILSISATVTSEGLDILTVGQSDNQTIKNITQNSITTKNIDDQTYKVKNPTFEIVLKGTTNAQVDLNSIMIEGVPREAYTVEKTSTGIKINFKDYTLTKNVKIAYNTLSANAGQIYTETTISSESLDQMESSRKLATTSATVLKFSEGDAEGIVYMAQAKFRTYQENDKAINVSGVHFELIDNVINTKNEFVTDSTGSYNFDSILTGEYTLRVTKVPADYSVDAEYLAGKVIKLAKGNNLIEVPLTPLVDQTSVEAKDSTIYVGTTWNAVDNFVSATDKDGNMVNFDQLVVSGNVNTSKVGDYEITYKNQSKEAKAIVHVVDNQETLAVKDSTIYVGDSWKSGDNFLSATDKDGKSIPVADVTVLGTVDTTTAGIYDVTYSYGSQTQIAKITVKADLSTVVVKDSTLFVGDKWVSKDNFISATDRDGQIIPFDQVIIEGTVDTQEKGEHKVAYTVEIIANSKLLFSRILQVNSKQLTSVATITVIEREIRPVDPDPSTPDPGEKPEVETPKVEIPKTEILKENITKPDNSKFDEKEEFPKTGEQVNYYVGLVGVISVLLSFAWFGKRKRFPIEK
ncbi:bacterial Ig-like domain-containing protein [Carnobacterium gallinarum]|uniref:bacterial Ig-like domain-containing protein n=1 Tax=Carnobacterium gallinarum TaxID=2749 RepID=UPI0005545325|nr:bacterial Ig-like domain-containing protein [Carnobacterium gallinarum]